MGVPGASFKFDTTTRFRLETEVVMSWRMDPFFVRIEGVCVVLRWRGTSKVSSQSLSHTCMKHCRQQ